MSIYELRRMDKSGNIINKQAGITQEDLHFLRGFNSEEDNRNGVTSEIYEYTENEIKKVY